MRVRQGVEVNNHSRPESCAVVSAPETAETVPPAVDKQPAAARLSAVAAAGCLPTAPTRKAANHQPGGYIVTAARVPNAANMRTFRPSPTRWATIPARRCRHRWRNSRAASRSTARRRSFVSLRRGPPSRFSVIGRGCAIGSGHLFGVHQGLSGHDRRCRMQWRSWDPGERARFPVVVGGARLTGFGSSRRAIGPGYRYRLWRGATTSTPICFSAGGGGTASGLPRPCRAGWFRWLWSLPGHGRAWRMPSRAMRRRRDGWRSRWPMARG